MTLIKQYTRTYPRRVDITTQTNVPLDTNQSPRLGYPTSTAADATQNTRLDDNFTQRTSVRLTTSPVFRYPGDDDTTTIQHRLELSPRLRHPNIINNSPSSTTTQLGAPSLDTPHLGYQENGYYSYQQTEYHVFAGTIYSALVTYTVFVPGSALITAVDDITDIYAAPTLDSLSLGHEETPQSEYLSSYPSPPASMSDPAGYPYRPISPLNYGFEPNDDDSDLNSDDFVLFEHY